jgi:hypothetical protein
MHDEACLAAECTGLALQAALAVGTAPCKSLLALLLLLLQQQLLPDACQALFLACVPSRVALPVLQVLVAQALRAHESWRARELRRSSHQSKDSTIS